MTEDFKQKQFYITQLPIEALSLIYMLLLGKIESYENAYMAEIRLDKPLEHIKTGGDGFIIHTGIGQERSLAKHLNDINWVVIHKNDISIISDSDRQNLEKIAKEYIEKELKLEKDNNSATI